MNKILIIRPSSIGDIVMASGMIRALRDAWPQGYIAWVADPQARDLLIHNPELNEVIFWPKETWKQLFAGGNFYSLGCEIRQFIGNLRQRHFDLAIDATGLFRSRMMAWLSGAGQRIGFESKEPGSMLMTQITSRGPDVRNMSSEYADLIHTLGLSFSDFYPFIVLSGRDQEAARNKMSAAGLDTRYAVLCPFTTRPQKEWVSERWAELAERVSAEFNLDVILLGGPGDVEKGRQIQLISQSRLPNFCGKTTLGESAAIVKEASLIIGVDTGLTHMGSAFERPTVALFGATCPYLSTLSPQTIVIYQPHDSCSPCHRRPSCKGTFACMRAISSAQVFNTAKTLLQTLKSS